MSDPIRELEIAKAQLASLRTELATMAELNASQREILHTVAVERDAAVSALALATNSTPGKGTGVWVPLDKWEELQTQLALVGRYGARQWIRGNAGLDPQEFDEWRHEAARE